jgi:hypothetical protein
MTETPETETSHTPAARSYDGWQLSDDAREQDRLFNERADAHERWQHEQSGWAAFAVAILLLAGGFQVINGFIALFRSGIYQVGRSGLVVDIDYTTWGWIHLALGILAIGAAFGLLGGNLWARILGVGLAAVSAIVYMTFIKAFPALSLVVIAMNILVIYAITVHGRDLEDADH